MRRKARFQTSDGEKPLSGAADPFTQDRFNEIFRVPQPFSDRIVSRECGWLEFKETFDWGNREDYAKTMAAFANARGGYIVWGVGDKPRRLLGLRDDRFEKIDPATVSGYVNDLFSPEIRWEMQVHEFSGKIFGLVCVYEATNKPVIATKNSGSPVREGEIYYRYRGRTSKIRYAELREMLDEQRRREQDYWMHHLMRIAKVGVTNAAVFDLETGTVKGTKGSFIIDESLLPKLKFVKEGHFHESKGAPALKLFGEVTPASGIIRPVKTVIKTIGIRMSEIIRAFLQREVVAEPLEYIRQICFESSAFLPVHYFIRQADLTVDETLQMINQVQSRSPSKERLIKRLGSEEDLALPIPVTQSTASKKKREYRQKVIDKTLNEELTPEDIMYALRAIRTLEPGSLDPKYLFPFLQHWFDDYFANRKVDVVGDLRKTICYLDYVFNYVAL